MGSSKSLRWLSRRSWESSFVVAADAGLTKNFIDPRDEYGVNQGNLCFFCSLAAIGPIDEILPLVAKKQAVVEG